MPPLNKQLLVYEILEEKKHFSIIIYNKIMNSLFAIRLIVGQGTASNYNMYVLRLSHWWLYTWIVLCHEKIILIKIYPTPITVLFFPLFLAMISFFKR
jgi:hypothetical protein